jgi:precorrin-2 dehydrogenase/sirohydrochlorin ferrochelatase
MFPIALDLSRVAVLLVGSKGRMLDRRKSQLEEAKAAHVQVLEDRLPTAEEVAASTVVMACGLPLEDARSLAQMARAAGKLVNVEDVIELCDFYFTANVRRGDLLIAVSTGGASPTLARRVRDYIGRRFGAEWAQYTQQMADERLALRAHGAGMKEVLAASDAMLENKGWLACKGCTQEAA